MEMKEYKTCTKIKQPLGNIPKRLLYMALSIIGMLQATELRG